MFLVFFAVEVALRIIAEGAQFSPPRMWLWLLMGLECTINSVLSLAVSDSTQLIVFCKQIHTPSLFIKQQLGIFAKCLELIHQNFSRTVYISKQMF